MENSDLVYLSATEALALFRVGAALERTRSWLDWGQQRPALG